MAEKKKPERKRAPRKGEGRPTKYNSEIAEKICDLVATSTDGIRKICALPGMPDITTVNLWRYKHPEFSLQYYKAKAHQAELLAEQTLEIADDNSADRDEDGKAKNELVNRSRLRVDTRKWMAEKLSPKIYGREAMLDEKIIENQNLQAELEKVRAELAKQHKKDC